MDNALTLFELNNLVRTVVDGTFDGSYWLKAELSEVHENSNGNCYLTFVQKDSKTDRPVARANGCIWRERYGLIRTDFEMQTGQRLTPGMTVLVEVTVHFHEYFGYSLYVDDIDPAYTLGDQSRRRREIVAQLEAEGVASLNRELPWPRPATRIAIISSATAAGYGDFCHQLAASPYRFVTRLFPAVMQGERTESSIIAALDAIAAERELWDTVVIIRGGGAVTDLSGFDTYALADNVAQFPLPVLSGIGHERDETVIDLVAFRSLKTPTAVAAYLISLLDDEAAQLRQAEERLRRSIAGRLDRTWQHFGQTARRLSQAFALYATREASRADSLSRRLATAASRRQASESQRLEILTQRLKILSRRQVETGHHRIALLEQAVQSADPLRILRMGYSITLRNGELVRSAASLAPGDRITTRMADGDVDSTVV